MSFVKKTKNELKAIADELKIDVDGIVLKKGIADKIAENLVDNYDYHVKNGTKYAKSAKYYKHGSPVKEKSSSSDAFTSPTKPPKTIIVDDLEAIDSADEDTEDASEEVAETEGDVEETEAKTTSKFEDIKDYLEDKYYEIEDFIVEKNYDLRDRLSDPFQINRFVTYYELATLFAHFYETIPVGKSACVPQLIKDNLPAAVATLPVLNLCAFLNVQFLSTFFLWFVSSYLAPTITSYYINFSYDFESDPFIYALSKVFYGIVLFRSQISASEVKKELAYSISSSSFTCAYLSQFFHHNLLEGTILLRGLFGNWDVVIGGFASIVAFYAQSQIDAFDEDYDDEDDYDDYEEFEGYSDIDSDDDEEEHTHSHSHY